MKSFIIVAISLLICLSSAKIYPKDYVLVTNLNFQGGVIRSETCNTQQEFLRKAVLFINQNSHLAASWSNEKKILTYFQLNQVNAQQATNDNNRNGFQTIFYGGIIEKNYALLQAIDMVGGDIRDEGSDNYDQALQKAIQYINGDYSRAVTIRPEDSHIWYKEIFRVKPVEGGDHEKFHSVIFGQQLNIRVPKLQYDYYQFDQLDLTGGDIRDFECDSLQKAVSILQENIKDDQNFAITFVEQSHRCHYKILQRVNPSDVDQQKLKWSSFIFGEVLSDTTAIVRGISVGGESENNEKLKNDNDALQSALKFINNDQSNFACWQREADSDYHIYYKKFQKSNFQSSERKLSEFCVFQARQLHLITPDPEINHCAIVFNQCNYQGQYLYICQDHPSLPKGFQVKSVKVPKGYVVEIYVNSNFSGKKVTVDKDTPCLE